MNSLQSLTTSAMLFRSYAGKGLGGVGGRGGAWSGRRVTGIAVKIRYPSAIVSIRNKVGFFWWGALVYATGIYTYPRRLETIRITMGIFPPASCCSFFLLRVGRRGACYVRV